MSLSQETETVIQLFAQNGLRICGKILAAVKVRTLSHGCSSVGMMEPVT